MVTGMKDAPNWMPWLLVGLAIFPMLIPAWRRYQVLRLRGTAARLRRLKNAVPAGLSFEKKRSPYLTPRGMLALHVERRGISRVWFVLVISNLIAIPLLTVLTGVVYYRISIESFSPPYYSIWVKLSERRHRVEFIISPWRDFLMTVDGEVVYRI
jgi:hypothetical protein